MHQKKIIKSVNCQHFKPTYETFLFPFLRKTCLLNISHLWEQIVVDLNIYFNVKMLKEGGHRLENRMSQFCSVFHTWDTYTVFIGSSLCFASAWLSTSALGLFITFCCNLIIRFHCFSWDTRLVILLSWIFNFC